MKNLHLRIIALCSSMMMSLLFLAVSLPLQAESTSEFIPILGNASIQNATCFSGSNGSVSLDPSGGIEPYTYLWSTGSTSSSVSGLSAGIYAFTVTDQDGNFVCDNIFVGQASSIQANLSRVNNDCRFDTNGSLSLAPTGGTPPYTYNWSTGSTDAAINNLAAGSYSYTITDSNGCSKTGGISVLANDPVVGQLTTRDVNCYGEPEGSATLEGSGGSGGYTYAWSNGATGSDVAGLAAGAYSYTITDALGCTGTGEFAIQQPAPVWTTFEYSYACFGEDNGYVEVFANGGTPPYTYEWNTGATTSSITDLGVGMYFYTVTDVNGCESATGLACIFNSDYSLNVTSSAANCVEGADGSASLIVASGLPPFSYQWSNGETTANVTGLAPGSYSYTVMDAGNCPMEGSITIGQGNLIVASVIALVDDNLQASGSGGVAPYTFLWSNGETGATALNYVSGTYSVTVTDNNGCFGVTTGDVPETSTCPGNVTYAGTIGHDQYLCAPGNTPATLVGLDSPSGGVGPLEYVWMKSSTTGTFDPDFFFPIPNSNSPNYSPGPLSATTYFIRCVRRNGCVYLESNTVTVTVGNEIEPILERPSIGCFLETQTYTASNLPPFADVSWSFSGPVTTNTTTGPSVEVTFNGAGYLDVTLTVSTNDCTTTFTETVTIANCFGNGGAQTQTSGNTPADFYPNPVTDRVTFDLGEVSEKETMVNVYNVTQNLLATYRVSPGLKYYEITMAQLPSGMYYVQLQKANGQVETLKVLKN